jgi:nicotinate-nucleotide adenylyltransferase
MAGMSRIGIFGGTFDPPHLGHLILAAEAYDQLELSRLLWVLTPMPPHKLGQDISSTSQRLELVLAAIGSDPSFELSRVDIDRAAPQYTADTVKILKYEYPQAELVYLMGGDSLHDLPNWHQPVEFVQACDRIGVMRRPGDSIDLTELEQKIPQVMPKLTFIEAPLLEISAHEIRQRVSTGRPFRYYLPPAVYEIIQKSHIYQ